MAFFRLLCYQQTYYHRDEAFCRHITISACPAYGCGGGADELCALHHARPARSVLPIPLPPYCANNPVCNVHLDGTIMDPNRDAVMPIVTPEQVESIINNSNTNKDAGKRIETEHDWRD